MSNRFNKAALLAGTIMAGAMVATPAYAQENTDGADADDGFIVVTGSRIQRRNVDSPAPVAVVDSEEFELSGTVNVENVVNTLPQVVPGTTSFSNNPGNGTATLNLRGLGSQRTLVLVNGRRWMSYDTAQIVDLNTIPSFLLDSVDVVTGGASAVYGSDALAGVVNFRLKDVDGIEMGGQYSITERGDAARYEVHGAIGTSFDDGRGSATVYAEYYNRDSLFQGDRAFSNFALGGETDGDQQYQFGSSTLPNGVLRYLGGANGNTGLPAGTEFGPAGASGFGTGVVFDNTPGDFRQRAGDLYNYAPVNYLQLPQERYLMGGYADYEFSDGHEFYTEVSFVNNRVAQELAATPVTGNFNIDLATQLQFLVPSDQQQLLDIDAAETAQNALDGVADDPGVVNFFVQRRTIEASRRNSLDERSAFRVLGGVRGAINDNLNYDAYYMFARTRNSNIQAGNISRSAFQAGLDGTATPINIFGLNTLTPAMFQQIAIQAQNSDISSMQVASASINGFLGNLGMGGDDVGFAVGAEYRKVASQFIPDTALSSGDVIGFNAGLPTEGSYDVRELFAELNIPILGPDAGVEKLDVTAAARYSDYSLDAVGGVWTYAGGIEFAPVPDITLRAQYQRAVRAPNVGELFGGRAIGFPPATDPCNLGTGAALTATCVASGVPANEVGQGNIQPNGQIPATFGGFAGLGEETSDSYTFGVVLEPQFVPGLVITADYFNISIDDSISVFGGGLNNALDLCFNQVQDINDPICAPFAPGTGARSPGGAITTANNPLILAANIANQEVSGIDLQVNYGTTIPFSLLTDSGEQQLNLSFLGTWTEKSNFTPVQGFATVNECAGRFGTTCGEPTPKYKWTSRATFVDGPLTTSFRWRHLSGVRDDNDGVDYSQFNGVERINAYDLLDISFSFEVNENLTIAMGVDNVFDTLPQTPSFDAAGNVTTTSNGTLLGDNQEQANTYPSTYNVLGRDFFVSANVKF
ncbi:TonB-dependent receptor domain-containing protein [Pontixanthobacter aquaemixtae]|uniref:TonB-dependent receptor n=1 Tax=Pontixanthobacter aquaemixtae TaxID=1958940 RepID=A0A844ZQX5_9SPHN|nr:TonB-dependent receptor [Pontixanthobacter aquaemixtae]MXO89480.1 TonB-dependent receptor [Pontixanthobacter aquaemixtae]